MRHSLTLLICTHNRANLLLRALNSIESAHRPTIPVEILVAANACTDDTLDRLTQFRSGSRARCGLPIRVIEVPTPGKSHALNVALTQIKTSHVVFVDDDHRVDENFLVSIEEAIQCWPDAGLYCGRILPDWDGSEPAWVHETGAYRIYPLPVPRYDLGSTPREITAESGPIPGGGNLVLHHRVFETLGPFSTELGPQGHDLGGGEDSEYVLRALARGERCQYAPKILQYHYVDAERLRLSYLMRKGYQRTRSTARLHGHGRIPPFIWRKVLEYGLNSLLSVSWTRRRFYLVRLASAIGEVRGLAESGNRNRLRGLPLDGTQRVLLAAFALALAGLVTAIVAAPSWWVTVLTAAALPATTGTLAVLLKSVLDFSQTGPQIRSEILTHYRLYTLYALARLGFAAFLIQLWLAGIGVLGAVAVGALVNHPVTWPGLTIAGAASLILGVGLPFLYHLRNNPGLLVASMHYRTSRLYALWDALTPDRLVWLRRVFATLSGLFLCLGLWSESHMQPEQKLAFSGLLLAYLASAFAALWDPDARPRRQDRRLSRSPNILMLGSDTLRADRLGGMGYPRNLTPHIDRLAQAGTHFTNCYVPCARTAPSLVSLFTGTWPQTHGVRDNFVPSSETTLRVDTLPRQLKALGYRTAAISDWCGADLGKFSFGFDHTDLPEDQWNLKYLIRQGPKDLRLFLSLFMHNRLGRIFLPEIYYLGGVPLTEPLGRRARRLLARLAEDDAPFLLNVFYSTTHPPFASEWPWYTRYADPGYRGESKFAMARLTDPFEIIRRQGAPKEEFDLDQIIDLYDGCVAQFDHEVGLMLKQLDALGLADDTIVIVYSDHGMEFFEHDTWGQGNSAIGEASPRIPLVIRAPGRPAQGQVEAVVRSIDLAPTLIELAGGTPPASMEGVSLAACLAGAPCPELAAYNETGIWIADIPGLPEGHLRYPNLFELLEVPDRETGTLAIKPEYLDRILAAKDRMIRQGTWKLVVQPLENGETVKLFNLETDPGCQRDVTDAHPEIVSRLRTEISSIVTK